MKPDLIALFIMVPWLIFDVYFLIMSVALLALKNRPIAKAANLESIPQYNEQAVVLIPTYNNSRTTLKSLIPQLMDWIGRQQDLPISVTIIDSSTDGTEDQVALALNLIWNVDTHDRRIAHNRNLSLVHLKNRAGGKAWAINKVALGLKNKYFAILDSDWVLDFGAFGKTIHYLENNKQYAYAQMAWRATDNPMNFVAGLDQVSSEYRHQFENRVRTWENIPITIHGSAVVINTQSFCDSGGFNDGVLSEDVDLVARLMLNGKFGTGLCDLSMQQPPCDHLRQFFWQKARWAEGRSQMLRMYAQKTARSEHFTLKQKIFWIYYLAYFGRCVAFSSLLAIMVAGFITDNRPLAITCAGVMVFCLTLRIMSHIVTMAQQVNKVPLMCRLIEPFTFYGIGLLYTYTFFKGLFTSKGVWRVVESKTYT